MKFYKIILYSLLFLCSLSCKREAEEIKFYYTKNYPGDKWENHKTGLLWTLSYLGAELPKGSFDKAITWKDSTTFTFDFAKVGFNETAISAIKVISDSLKSTPHYKKKNAADIGAFVALTIGCSEHYYRITNVPENIKDLTKQHLGNFSKFLITKSAVAKHHRVIKYSKPSPDPTNWLFIAEEGNGDLKENTFKSEFLEVFDVMPNGQLRFMIFDSKGNRIPASPKNLGEAGKPAKCLWCHEIVIQPLFEKTDSLKNSVSLNEFQNDVITLMTNLNQYRSKLKSDVDFKKTQDHTQMELEYISYMQPSVKKLAKEWGITENEVQNLLGAIKSHEHEEFKFLNKIFDRKDIGGLRTLFPEDIREPNNHEINFFK